MPLTSPTRAWNQRETSTWLGRMVTPDMPKPSSAETADVLERRLHAREEVQRHALHHDAGDEEEPADRIAVDEIAGERAHRADDEDDHRGGQEDGAARPVGEGVDDVRIDGGDGEDAEAEPEQLDDDAGGEDVPGVVEAY